jgi:hypothetical protein
MPTFSNDGNNFDLMTSVAIINPLLLFQKVHANALRLM